MNEQKIENISDYIKSISELTSVDSNYAFRGESKYNGNTRCTPNIYRKEQYLSSEAYEKNILNKVRSEGFDNQKSYLLTAIEAQHGGFPSRLLDISYNCLIALYFATASTITEKQKEEKDGYVYIIKIENMMSASSTELEEFYVNSLINQKSLISQSLIFSHQHKMIDFYSKNARIKAQQGGFILFYGNEYRPLPEYLVQNVIIPAKAKEKIRSELNAMFNISDGYVYPESNNIANGFLDFSKVYSKENNLEWKVEMNNIITMFEKNLKFQYEKFQLEQGNELLSPEYTLEKFKEIEQYIAEFYIDFDQSITVISNMEENSIGFLENKIREVDDIVELVSDIFTLLGKKQDVSFSTVKQMKRENCKQINGGIE